MIGTPPPNWDRLGTSPAQGTEELERLGVEGWAKKNMAKRLGSKFPKEGADYWTQLMSKTALSTLIGFGEILPHIDISGDLPRIQCPTLVMTTEASALGSVESTRAWQQLIPNSELRVIPGDSYHLAASDADRCAQETREFILKHVKKQTGRVKR